MVGFAEAGLRGDHLGCGRKQRRKPALASHLELPDDVGSQGLTESLVGWATMQNVFKA